MSDILWRLRLMGDRQNRHEYDIGDYWNIVDEAADEIERLRADREILDWLDKEAFGIALVHDDDGRWAVCGDGMQNVRIDGQGPLSTSFYIEEDRFYPTARAALAVAMREWRDTEEVA